MAHGPKVRVQTVQELDEFLTKAKAALIQANGDLWPVTKRSFDQCASDMRETFAITSRKRHPTVREMYIVDEGDRVAWEASNRFGGTSIIIQVPKPRP